MNLKQRYLQWKAKRSEKIYIVCLWAKWCVQEVPLYRFKKGEPQIILWTDHNGFKEEYYIGPWQCYSTGAAKWFRSKEVAKECARTRNYLEGLE